ncbi:hypothetical protein LXL04_022436 [Taraxacum kok-saghyz]
MVVAGRQGAAISLSDRNRLEQIMWYSTGKCSISFFFTANLASSPPPSVVAPPESKSLEATSFGLVEDQFVDASLRLTCYEEVDGRKFKYLAPSHGVKFNKGSNSIRVVTLQSRKAPADEFISFIRSYVVPEGFPDSHFFGGAMGVFTTQALLHSVDVSKNQAMPGAVAINWTIKDGSGRIGDLLMELGAGVELATTAALHLFLPLACAANVAKVVE